MINIVHLNDWSREKHQDSREHKTASRRTSHKVFCYTATIKRNKTISERTKKNTPKVFNECTQRTYEFELKQRSSTTITTTTTWLNFPGTCSWNEIIYFFTGNINSKSESKSIIMLRPTFISLLTVGSAHATLEFSLYQVTKTNQSKRALGPTKLQQYNNVHNIRLRFKILFTRLKKSKEKNERFGLIKSIIFRVKDHPLHVHFFVLSGTVLLRKNELVSSI